MEQDLLENTLSDWVEILANLIISDNPDEYENQAVELRHSLYKLLGCESYTCGDKNCSKC